MRGEERRAQRGLAYTEGVAKRGKSSHGSGAGIHYTVPADEGFEQSARALFALVQQASHQNAGRPRHLHLEIEGHTNAAGGFDQEMLKLQRDFVCGALLPYLTRASTPLLEAKNPGAQTEVIPDDLLINASAGDRAS